MCLCHTLMHWDKGVKRNSHVLKLMNTIWELNCCKGCKMWWHNLPNIESVKYSGKVWHEPHFTLTFYILIFIYICKLTSISGCVCPSKEAVSAKGTSSWRSMYRNDNECEAYMNFLCSQNKFSIPRNIIINFSWLLEFSFSALCPENLIPAQRISCSKFYHSRMNLAFKIPSLYTVTLMFKILSQQNESNVWNYITAEWI